MSALLAAMLLLAVPDASAGDEPSSEDASDASAEASGSDPDHAEYVRLQQELEKLVARNAWAGVERTYQKLVATGVAPAFEDHVAGAHAARALGDMGSVRARLMAAKELKEDREILEWLWDIDSNYGKVFLACDGGKLQVELTAAAMPFNPDQRRAVEFSIQSVADDCLFDGYLPQGDYTFGTFDVKVVPRVQSVSIDLRNMELPSSRKSRKKKKGREVDEGTAAR